MANLHDPRRHNVIRSCRNCKHSTQEDLSKYHRRWLVRCRLADHYTRMAEWRFHQVEYPECIDPPRMRLMERDTITDCKFWETKDE